MGVYLHVHVGVQLDLIRPLEYGRIDHNSSVEGVVLEARVQVQLVAVGQDIFGQATLGDQFLFLGQVYRSAVSCAL